MGILTITTDGSFPRREKTFYAETHGHAHAVAEAITFLTADVLPSAIEQDHQLAAGGAKPNDGWNRKRPSALWAAMKAAGWTDRQVGAAMDAAGAAGG